MRLLQLVGSAFGARYIIESVVINVGVFVAQAAKLAGQSNLIAIRVRCVVLLPFLPVGDGPVVILPTN